MRGPLRLDEINLADRLSLWLHGRDGDLEISEMEAGEK